MAAVFVLHAFVANNHRCCYRFGPNNSRPDSSSVLAKRWSLHQMKECPTRGLTAPENRTERRCCFARNIVFRGCALDGPRHTCLRLGPIGTVGGRLQRQMHHPRLSAATRPALRSKLTCGERATELSSPPYFIWHKYTEPALELVRLRGSWTRLEDRGYFFSDRKWGRGRASATIRARMNDACRWRYGARTCCRRKRRLVPHGTQPRVLVAWQRHARDGWVNLAPGWYRLPCRRPRTTDLIDFGTENASADG